MSQLEVDKIIPQSGTTLTIGDSGDTITFADGAVIGIDTDTLYIDSTNNRVGIGTSSPATTLDVQGGNITQGATGSNAGRLLIDNTTDTIQRIKVSRGGSTGQLAFHTGTDSEAMRITSSGNVGIGTSSPAKKLVIESSTQFDGIHIRNGSNIVAELIGFDSGNDGGGLKLRSGGTALAEIRTSGNTFFNGGNVGIGTSSPSANLEVKGSGANAQIWLSQNTNSTYSQIYSDSDGTFIISADQGNTSASSSIRFKVDASEVMRIDSSGNVSIGKTSSAGKSLELYASSNTAMRIQNSTTGTTGFDGLLIEMGGSDALIYNYENGVMKFGTNNAERMRIDGSGVVYYGTTNGDPASANVVGTAIRYDSGQKALSVTGDGQTPAAFNLKGTDGNVVNINQDGTTEGAISVSGSTVTYVGGHLGRWSQLISNTRDESIVKGTVMSNLDEMCVWGDEDNEQLNKMKVSDTEGDDNVSGVFVNWDDFDDVYTNDMNIAMTGDMVIRIAQGVTVTKGQLLMSAGDGTAKPQGDDIVRSKTIAKVTSNNVSKTYDDGSYLVPCVLMAC